MVYRVFFLTFSHTLFKYGNIHFIEFIHIKPNVLFQICQKRFNRT